MIATILSDDHEVIDTDAARIGAFTNSLDVVTIEGDGVSLSTLRQAEIEAADLFIANTDNDETNIIASADEDECEQFEETVEKK